MDAALFAQLLSDKKVTNLKKLGYKYPQANIPEFIGLLKNGFYKPIPLKDFHGNSLVYLEGITQPALSSAHPRRTARKGMESTVDHQRPSILR